MATPTNYPYTKAAPVNLALLQNQINADTTISVQCTGVSYAAPNLTVSMADVLTGAEKTELDAVVARHDGTDKGFTVNIPLEIYDDFITGATSGNLGWNATVANGGSVGVGQSADADHLGILQLATGISTGMAALDLGLGTLMVGGGGKAQMEFLVEIPTLSQGTDTYTLFCGLGDAVLNEPANGIYLAYDSRVSPNWLCKAATGGTRQVLDTGWPVNAGWRKFSFVVAADGTSVNCFVDDGRVGQLTQNIPVGVAMGPSLSVHKLTGIANRVANIDYFYILKNTDRTDPG